MFCLFASHFSESPFAEKQKVTEIYSSILLSSAPLSLSSLSPDSLSVLLFLQRVFCIDDWRVYFPDLETEGWKNTSDILHSANWPDLRGPLMRSADVIPKVTCLNTEENSRDIEEEIVCQCDMWKSFCLKILFDGFYSFFFLFFFCTEPSFRSTLCGASSLTSCFTSDGEMY